MAKNEAQDAAAAFLFSLIFLFLLVCIVWCAPCGCCRSGMCREIRKYPSIWFIFFYSTGMLILVNQIELSFARTLVVCEVPGSPKKEGELWSGSLRCGDRQQVINEGQMLSSVAQSQENLARIAMMLAAAVLTDVYGRRPMLLVGLGCCTLSVLCFVGATLWAAWARTLFVAGQGLQGAFPAEMLFGLVATDLADLEGKSTSSVRLFEAKECILAFGAFFFGWVAFVIQAVEPMDYLPVWTSVLVLSTIALVLAFGYCPETRNAALKETPHQSVLQSVVVELRGYRDFATGSSIMWYDLFQFIALSLMQARVTIFFSEAMGYYNLPQAFVLLCFAPTLYMKCLFMPLTGCMSRVIGFKATWCLSLTFLASLGLLQLGVPYRFEYLMAPVFLEKLFSGFLPLDRALVKAIFGDNTSKYVSLQALVGYGVVVAGGPLYAALFDAKAQGYWARLRPHIFAMAMWFLHLAILVCPSTGLLQRKLAALDTLERERAAEAAAAASTEDKKTI